MGIGFCAVRAAVQDCRTVAVQHQRHQHYVMMTAVSAGIGSTMSRASALTSQPQHWPRPAQPGAIALSS
jgi:hypothetical protein